MIKPVKTLSFPFQGELWEFYKACFMALQKEGIVYDDFLNRPGGYSKSAIMNFTRKPSIEHPNTIPYRIKAVTKLYQAFDVERLTNGKGLGWLLLFSIDQSRDPDTNPRFLSSNGASHIVPTIYTKDELKRIETSFDTLLHTVQQLSQEGEVLKIEITGLKKLLV